jgi:glucose-6-phosphate isomerase
MTIWTELSTAWDHLRSTRMSQLFDNDPARAARFLAKTGDMMFDFSKTHITDEVLSLLVELARKSNVEEKRTAMFAGEKINETEGRAVLHTA